jgi:hypothetical protein
MSGSGYFRGYISRDWGTRCCYRGVEDGPPPTDSTHIDYYADFWTGTITVGDLKLDLASFQKAASMISRAHGEFEMARKVAGIKAELVQTGKIVGRTPYESEEKGE